MNPRERIERLLSGKSVDRPPFYPAIYDYKSSLVNVPSHLFAQTVGEIYGALSQEVASLDAEALTAAYDIYNIEAEALGGIVARNSGIIMPEIHQPLIGSLEEIASLIQIKQPSGRMPLFIEAAKQAVHDFGNKVLVRGGLSGPFSMAAKIFPREDLLVEVLMNPEGVQNLLRFCTDTIKIYMNGFLGAGAGIAIFDSFIAPPMLSPQNYEEIVLPFHQELFAMLREKGISLRALIVGGNTLPILPNLVKSGANQFILDYNIPIENVREVMTQYPEMLFRINLPPSLIMAEDMIAIANFVHKTLEIIGDKRNLILGTGILPPRTPQKHILQVKSAMCDFYGQKD